MTNKEMKKSSIQELKLEIEKIFEHIDEVLYVTPYTNKDLRRQLMYTSMDLVDLWYLL